MNPIERLCDELDRHVRPRQTQPQTLPQMAQALHAGWATILKRVVPYLVASVGRRCQAVVALQGTNLQ